MTIPPLRTAGNVITLRIVQTKRTFVIPSPRGIRPHSVGAETGPKDNKDHGGSADDPTQVGSAEVLRRQHLARQKQRTHQNGGKAVEVPSGRTVLGTPAPARPHRTFERDQNLIS